MLLTLRVAVAWYQTFNTIEAGLWAAVACLIVIKAPRDNRRQRWGVAIASIAFLAFGLSDLLEVRFGPHLPWWLWAMKIACGSAILAGRYTWLGWSKFRWNDREFLLGLSLLAAAIAVIILQATAA